MKAGMNQIASDLYKSLTESNDRKPKAYDTKAEVLREEGNIVWVKIPGGVDETPVQKTNNASPGDTVMVRVSGGRAWVLGNNTSPATDDTRANQAYQVGSEAGAIANVAINEANRARSAADSAEAEAIRAHAAATAAQGSADDAQKSADDAQQSADKAFQQMSVVENIVGVLDLVAEKGVYEPTEDIDIQADKWYFKRDGTSPNYIYSVETSPESVYHLTEDTDIESDKTYYTRTGEGTEEDPYVYTEVETPIVAEISTYYEKYYNLVDISDSIRNYVSSHLVLLDDGLWLRPDTGATQIHISTVSGNEGVIIYGPDDKTLAKYGSTAIIGDPQGFHLEIGDVVDGKPEVGFYLGSQKVAYLNSDELYVQNSLSFGNFVFLQRANGHFTLKVID